jgi:hypothetical protein
MSVHRCIVCNAWNDLLRIYKTLSGGAPAVNNRNKRCKVKIPFFKNVNLIISNNNRLSVSCSALTSTYQVRIQNVLLMFIYVYANWFNVQKFTIIKWISINYMWYTSKISYLIVFVQFILRELGWKRDSLLVIKYFLKSWKRWRKRIMVLLRNVLKSLWMLT